MLAGNRHVGTIVQQDLAGSGVGWWWEITTREAQRWPGREIKGPAATRDAAMAAFRAAWDALVSSSAVRDPSADE